MREMTTYTRMLKHDAKEGASLTGWKIACNGTWAYPLEGDEKKKLPLCIVCRNRRMGLLR